MGQHKPFALGLFLFSVLFGWFAYLIALSDAKSIPISCGDNDCRGDETFCWEGHCTRCIPCEKAFNRQPPHAIDGDCALTLTACGECLPGFVSMNLTGTPSIECQPIVSFSHQNIIVISTALGLLLVFVIFLFICYYNKITLCVIGIFILNIIHNSGNFFFRKLQAKHSNNTNQAQGNGAPTPGNNLERNPNNHTDEPNQYLDLGESEETWL